MQHLTRRGFMQSALTAATVAAGSGRAIEPIRRTGQPHLRLSLAAYSLRDALNVARKPKPEMTLEQFAEFAAANEFDAVEPTAYYFADTSPDYLHRLKMHCTRLGLDVSGSACGNDFCHPESDKLNAQLDYVRAWIENTARLGGKTLRIFAGSVKKGDSEEKARKRCVAAIEEACSHAARHGVLLALENHGGITATAEQTLALVKAVRHEAFGVNLDTGNFHTADPYADLARLAPYAVVVQLKTEIRRDTGKKEEADLGRKIDMLKQVGYRGYVVLEYEAADDPKTAIPKYAGQLRKLIAAGS